MLQDHHEGYITWREYKAIQAAIRENAHMEGRMTRGAPREGAALLAGLLHCPGKVTLEEINAVLERLGQPGIGAEELAPLAAA